MAKSEKYKYEVHEQTSGRFVWHVWDDNDDLVDYWSRDGKVELVDGVETRVNDSVFRTEKEAADFVESKYKGATCKTKFTEA